MASPLFAKIEDKYNRERVIPKIEEEEVELGKIREERRNPMDFEHLTKH